jgi:Zn-dependent protease with chaperone function
MVMNYRAKLLKKDTPINWQRLVKDNRRKAHMLVAAFILYSAGIGFVLDVIFGLLYYKTSFFNTVNLLLTFQQPMYATLAGFVIGTVLMFFFYLLHQKIMLLGLPVRILNRDDTVQAADKNIVNMVETIAKAMKLATVPKIYLAEVLYPNVFVSGAHEKYQCIVITQGLVDTLNNLQLQAVIAAELAHLKMGDNQLTLAVAMVSHVSLICFDSFYYSYLRQEDEDEDNEESIPMLLFCKALRMQRFMLPIGTFLFRFALNRNRIYLADRLAVKLMHDNKPLGEALSILNTIYYEKIDFFRKAYGDISHDEIRRESYFIDPANFNTMRTIATPLTTHPSIQERLEKIDYVP